MTRPYRYRPGVREKVAERMRRLNADPLFADKAQRRASLRMRRIHELARKAAESAAGLQSGVGLELVRFQQEALGPDGKRSGVVVHPEQVVLGRAGER